MANRPVLNYFAAYFTLLTYSILIIQKYSKMRGSIAAFVMVFSSSTLLAQSMKKPSVPEPSIMKIKKVRSHSSYNDQYMGLWDWNFAGGYINKTATLDKATTLGVNEQNTSGQYIMFQLQESILSNYIWAKSYKRNKRVKFGLQNTYEPGIRWGQAIRDSSNYSTVAISQPSATKVFFNYQLGLALALRINDQVDVGFTYYPFVNSVLTPGVDKYSKLRFRYGPLMAEYSFGDKTALEFKYLRGKKIYIGASYTKTDQSFTNPYYHGYGTSNTATSLYQISIGRVF
jgi:hypothetical protein